MLFEFDMLALTQKKGSNLPALPDVVILIINMKTKKKADINTGMIFFRALKMHDLLTIQNFLLNNAETILEILFFFCMLTAIL
ncbi:hypothetical protein NQ318_022724 [Aromia moschata]|uniref:Uncharacterized protein n=1 Tax=Aromia moschata TaxID=1265417 RepID=A0AAV8YDJ2_9CUCU|nr:hypothetical protein NQ318_022724 [Aromia moschata]